VDLVLAEGLGATSDTFEGVKVNLACIVQLPSALCYNCGDLHYCCRSHPASDPSSRGKEIPGYAHYNAPRLTTAELTVVFSRGLRGVPGPHKWPVDRYLEGRLGQQVRLVLISALCSSGMNWQVGARVWLYLQGEPYGTNNVRRKLGLPVNKPKYRRYARCSQPNIESSWHPALAGRPEQKRLRR
jgi:hypothetical protein